MIVSALVASALIALTIRANVKARRVGGIVFIKAGPVNLSYSRSKAKRAPRVTDERQGYAPRAYVVPVPVMVADTDERQGYGFRAYTAR